MEKEIKRCWICGKTEEEISKVHNITQMQNDNAVWKTLESLMFNNHLICIVCDDLLVSLASEWDDDNVFEEKVEIVMKKVLGKLLRPFTS